VCQSKVIKTSGQALPVSQLQAAPHGNHRRTKSSVLSVFLLQRAKIKPMA
jgi:hypothetical protein